METARYVFGVLLVIGLPPGMLWWFLVHPFVGFWRRVGAVETIIIMAAVGILGAVGLLAIRDTLLLADYGTQPVLVALAAALATTSVWIAVKRRKHLTTSILVGMPELEEGGHGGRLLSEGIYSRVRHPRYVEIVLGCLAYALFANYLGAYIVAVLCIGRVRRLC
jgi:protein-S-isoprenylcysteine O-methyltransferase Ste14